MTKLNEFIANVKQGMAKPQHFTIDLPLPSKLYPVFKGDMRKVILFCDQAQIPGLSFSTSQVRSTGEFKEVPYEKLFESVTLNFYVDVDMHVRKLFESWVDLIQNPVTREFSWPSDYITNKINIIVIDAQDDTRYIVTLNRAYPKSVSPIQLDYAGRDVLKLSVVFTYQYATSELWMPAIGRTDNRFNTIPEDYTNNFKEFQTQTETRNYIDETYKNIESRVIDSIFTNAKSLYSNENMGEITGFGNIFV